MENGPRLDKIRQSEADVKSAGPTLAKAQCRLDNCTIKPKPPGTGKRS